MYNLLLKELYLVIQTKLKIMASQKDKDYHKLRNPEKYGLDGATYPLTKEDAEAHKSYQKLHDKYGNKSMVCDKRRRNSTRKSNQKTKAMSHQIDRSRDKRQVKQIVTAEDGGLFVEQIGWAKQHGFYF